jgi:(p)ppGpp synthase/HD superfamily hydrolase
MYSYRVEQAIRAAAVLHKDQTRRGSMPFPFVTHAVATAFTLLDYTDDEDVIIAAFLHDTLEDTDYTAEELREDFGARVCDIVETLTEPKASRDEPLSWRERKLVYLKQLKRGSAEAVLVAAADKIHNFRTIVEDYSDSYQRFYQDFGKNFSDRLEIYQQFADIVNARTDNPIVTEFNHVFESYRSFLLDAQKAHDYHL